MRTARRLALRMTSAPVPDATPTVPVLRLDEPRELLAYLPHRLGYRPRESLVLAGVRRDRTLGLVARADLADLAGPSGACLADSLAAHLLSDGACEVVLVAYTVEAPAPSARARRAGHVPSGPPSPSFARALLAAEAARSACGCVGPVQAWLVTDRRFLPLDDAVAHPCRAVGRPLRDLEGTEIAAAMVLAGSVVVDRREDLAQIPLAAPAARRAAASARLRWADVRRRALEECREAGEDEEAGDHDPGARTAGEAAARERGVGDAQEGAPGAGAGADAPAGARARAGGEAGRGARVRAGAGADDGVGADAGRDERLDARCDSVLQSWRESSLDSWEALVAEGEHPRPRLVGQVEAALTDTRVRDAALLTVLSPGGHGARGIVTATGAGSPTVGGEVRAALSGLLDVERARRPDPATTGPAVRALEAVVAHGRRRHQAPALALLGLLAWWCGNGPRASVLLARARADDPGHRLAALLDSAVAAGLPPAWVRAGVPGV